MLRYERDTICREKKERKKGGREGGERGWRDRGICVRLRKCASSYLYFKCEIKANKNVQKEAMGDSRKIERERAADREREREKERERGEREKEFCAGLR